MSDCQALHLEAGAHHSHILYVHLTALPRHLLGLCSANFTYHLGTFRNALRTMVAVQRTALTGGGINADHQDTLLKSVRRIRANVGVSAPSILPEAVKMRCRACELVSGVGDADHSDL